MKIIIFGSLAFLSFIFLVGAVGYIELNPISVQAIMQIVLSLFAFGIFSIAVKYS